MLIELISYLSGWGSKSLETSHTEWSLTSDIYYHEDYDAEVEGQRRIVKQYHDFEVFAIYFLPVVGLSSRY